MKRVPLIVFLLGLMSGLLGHARIATSPSQSQQPYDLLIKGGHVIDPRNRVDAVMDVAIAAGKVARVGPNIPVEQAQVTVKADGLYVTPGLVDMHVHAFYGTERAFGWGGGTDSLPPDGFTFRSGVTTIVDAGSSGWRTFPGFKSQVIDQARTRVVAFLNIVGHGMRAISEQDVSDMDPRLAAMRIKQYPEVLKGIKTAHYQGPEWDAVDRAVEAGRLADVPVMVDFGDFVPARPYQELVLKRPRPGDISTHMYRDQVPLLDGSRKLLPYLSDARGRGVLFDVGHGAGSFLFRQAVPAVRQGWTPDFISTDLHALSMNGGAKDLLNVMSKFLNMGMPLPDVISRATWNPAQHIKGLDLGSLGVGSDADLAVLNVRKGDFGFFDVSGARMSGAQKLECELTIRGGQIVWDLNGISKVEWEKASVKQ